MTADPLTRRRFIQGTAALTATVAIGACRDDASGEDTAPTTDRVERVATGSGTLVVVTLTGGNDGLNTVAPVNDSIYRSTRGALALDPASAHDIGEGFALHPVLTRTKALWDSDQLAVVHGVGFDGLDRSHFHCMDVWQAGDIDPGASGWLGRWLDLDGDDPLDAIAVGQGLPLLCRGDRRAAAVVPAGPFAVPGDDALRERLVQLARGDDGRSALEVSVAQSTTDLLATVDTVAPVVSKMPAEDTLAARLDTVAALIDGGLPTRAYAVDLGGFDTHAAQGGTHEALLSELDGALGAFLEQTVAHDVTVLIYSEFGRRVAPNGSAGTDHGGAGTVLVAGTVRPGHHGEPPPLDALADGDLATTVDFRSVYAGLLEGVLGVEATDVLGDPPALLSLV